MLFNGIYRMFELLYLHKQERDTRYSSRKRLKYSLILLFLVYGVERYDIEMCGRLYTITVLNISFQIIECLVVVVI